MLQNPPRNLAALIERLTTAYGHANVSVIYSIEAEMQLPFDPPHRVTWIDFRKRAKVDINMNISHPDILLQAWIQYADACRQQVTLYRLVNPHTAVADATITDYNTRPTGEYRFRPSVQRVSPQDRQPTAPAHRSSL